MRLALAKSNYPVRSAVKREDHLPKCVCVDCTGQWDLYSITYRVYGPAADIEKWHVDTERNIQEMFTQLSTLPPGVAVITANAKIAEVLGKLATYAGNCLARDRIQRKEQSEYTKALFDLLDYFRQHCNRLLAEKYPHEKG